MECHGILWGGAGHHCKSPETLFLQMALSFLGRQDKGNGESGIHEYGKPSEQLRTHFKSGQTAVEDWNVSSIKNCKKRLK